MSDHEYGSCPHCRSVRLERQHRGFIRKHIFRVQPLFTCVHCKQRFSKNKIKFISITKQKLHQIS